MFECHEWIEVKNEEVRRRAGIERELASKADERILRWFGHVDEYRMARRVLRAGTRETKVRLDGQCEGGLGQQRNDCGYCATMEIGKSGEPWYICNN